MSTRELIEIANLIADGIENTYMADDDLCEAYNRMNEYLTSNGLSTWNAELNKLENAQLSY